jgi:hypothetical protein
MACSKISSTPFISLLLHSMYSAPIFWATAWPCSWVTGVRPWVLRRSMQVLLVRRSDLRPMRTRGVYGQKWRTSGYHYDHVSFVYSIIVYVKPTLSMTFSSELGQSIAKQTNRRSVSGYESGRSRSYSSCPAVSHRASSTVFPLG